MFEILDYREIGLKKYQKSS